MKKLFFMLGLAIFIGAVLPVAAQEKEADKKAMSGEMASMMPPQPLNDEWFNWLVGEWEGWSDSPQGKTQDWEEFEMGLDGQFLFVESKSVMGNITYTGMGAITVHPQSGERLGYWIDNFRGMYEGKGKLEGNTITMEWLGNQGTYNETIEKLSDNKYKINWSFTDPRGNKNDGTKEMTKKPAVTEK
jgi:hypothetical protein